MLLAEAGVAVEDVGGGITVGVIDGEKFPGGGVGVLGFDAAE
jgi:hypothetical protein